MNTLLLGMASAASSYSNPHWITFKQAKTLGGCVRKGEKGTPIIFYKKLIINGRDGDAGLDDNGQKSIPMLRGYTVFNVEQCDNLPADKYPLPKKTAFISDC